MVIGNVERIGAVGMKIVWRIDERMSDGSYMFRGLGTTYVAEELYLRTSFMNIGRSSFVGRIRKMIDSKYEVCIRVIWIGNNIEPVTDKLAVEVFECEPF